MRPGGGRGGGVAALFAGDSGMGKPMSAEVLAADLGLDRYTVNLAAVIDKYLRRQGFAPHASSHERKTALIISLSSSLLARSLSCQIPASRSGLIQRDCLSRSAAARFPFLPGRSLKRSGAVRMTQG